MSLKSRKITITFQLGTGSFGNSGQYNTVTVEGLRCYVQISNGGANSMGAASIRIYGLQPTIMDSLSALNLPIGNTQVMSARKNTVLIAASDDDGNMATIYQGGIWTGQIDMNESPDTSLIVTAIAGIFDALNPIPPTSYPNSADAADIMKYLAGQMGYKFENNGVSVQLSTPYFPGSAREQAIRCANAANIAWTIDNGVLAIWPIDGFRKGTLPLISPDTGMIGYPTYWTSGISVKTRFNPLLKIGQLVNVKSSLLVANGNWHIYNLAHELESESPNGPWETSFNGSPNVIAGSTKNVQ